ncbi:MAG: hypothetical protein OXI33_05080, partial [Chloroflexota bacterium]|nr:hypothetical protein [Chloroflexota bacterium]
ALSHQGRGDKSETGNHKGCPYGRFAGGYFQGNYRFGSVVSYSHSYGELAAEFSELAEDGRTRE